MPKRKVANLANQTALGKPATKPKRVVNDKTEVKSSDFFRVDPSAPVYEAARKRFFQILIKENEEYAGENYGETNARNADGFFTGKLRNRAKYWDNAKRTDKRFNEAIDDAVFEQVVDWIARALGEAALAGAREQEQCGNVKGILNSPAFKTLYFETLEKMAWALEKVGTEPYLTAKLDPDWREKRIGERQVTIGKKANRPVTEKTAERNARMLEDFQRRKSAEPHVTNDVIYERMSLGGAYKSEIAEGGKRNSLTSGSIKNILKRSVRKPR